MPNKILYIQFKKFTFLPPSVIVQRERQVLPKTYEHVTSTSQWRLCDTVSKLLNEDCLSIQLTPDGEFEVQNKY